MNSKVELIIGDYSYYVYQDRIKAFPDSYFAVALSPQWNNQNNPTNNMNQKFTQLRIDDTNRNTELFEYIVDFLRYGSLPCDDVNGNCLIERSLLPTLRVEADYFCLHEMTTKIDAMLTLSDCSSRFLRDGLEFSNKLDDCCGVFIGTDVISRIKFDNSYDRNVKDGDFKDLSSTLFYASHNAEYVLGEGEWHHIVEEVEDEDLEWIAAKVFEKNMHCVLNDRIGFEQPCKLQLLGKMVNTHKNYYYEKFHERNLSDGQRSYGTLLVIAPSEYSGGEITVTSTENAVISINQSKHTFVVILNNGTYSVKTVTSGRQAIYKFDIQSSERRPECLKIEINYKTQVDLHLQTQLENQVYNRIEKLLIKHKYIGIIFEKDYVSEGLRADSLVGFDATLYAKMISMGVPVSLVHAINTIDIAEVEVYKPEKYLINEFSIHLIDKESLDTRNQLHRGNDLLDVPFIRSSKSKYGKVYYNEKYVNGFDCRKEKRIVAVMILGGTMTNI